MISRVTKWGNSLGVRIPYAIARQIGIIEGTSIILIVKDDQIMIKKKRYKLETMLKQIKPGNLQEEINCGEFIGKEIWE